MVNSVSGSVSLRPPQEVTIASCREKTVVAIVMAILGASLLATGLYLLIGSVGTIPAILFGFTYALGGTALFAGAALSLFTSFKQKI